jgi:hypothetical protein
MENNLLSTNVVFEVEDTRDIKSSSKISIIPQTDGAVYFVSDAVVSRWRESGYTSDQITVDRFEEIKNLYEVKLAEGGRAVAERTPTINRLGEIKELIQEGLRGLKSQLNIDFNAAKAISYYPTIGAQWTEGKYGYPNTYDGIAIRLKMTIEGLTKLGYQNHKYGLTFWQDVYDEFTELALLNRNLTGGNSSTRRTKNEVKEELQKGLRIVILLLKANKGDAWESVARDWGFLRERY